MDAPVVAPVSSRSASAVLRVAPLALFQLDWATTPARSAAPITVVALPTKLIPMAPRPTDDVLTLTVTAAERTRPPLVALTVNLKLPTGVLAGTATVMLATPAPVMD